jgi:erythromycin esterase
MGFTAIAIESGFSEAGRVQDFVAGGAGTADEIVRDNLTYGFGRFEVNVALVQWMHEYNARPVHRHKIAFYGVAVGLGGPRTATPTPVTIENRA